MNSPRVVSRSEVWSGSVLCLKSAFLGVLVFWIFFALGAFVMGGIADRLGARRTSLGVLAGVFLLLGPLVVFERHRFQIGSAQRAWFAGVGFGIGVVVTGLLFLAYVVYSEGSATSRQISIATQGFVAALSCPILYGLGSWIAWSLLRTWRPSVVIQDGTLCPSCAYCLRGNTTMRCPECGRAFTFDELGATEEWLRVGEDAISVGVNEMSPARSKEVSGRVWTCLAILITLGLGSTTLLVSAKVEFDVVVPMILVTALWSAFDSYKIQLRKYDSGLSYSPLILFALIALVWIIAFPWYLLTRFKIKKGLARLKGT